MNTHAPRIILLLLCALMALGCRPRARRKAVKNPLTMAADTAEATPAHDPEAADKNRPDTNAADTNAADTNAADTMAAQGQKDSLEAGAAGAAEARLAPMAYLKGSTHVHTVHSGDSQTPLAEVVRWYVEHDYDFIVITDHNRVTALPKSRELVLIAGVELTHNPGRCVPAPPEPEGRCRIHVNSLFVDPAKEVRLAARAGREPGSRMDWRERTSKKRVDMYQRALDRSAELAGLAQINHPTWHWGMDGALLVELGRRGAVLVEIANQAFVPWNQGKGDHPSTEAIWDAALAAGIKMWGVASDDAHHYYDMAARQRRAARTPNKRIPMYPAGKGFVMVNAQPDPAAIRRALQRGAFYSSTGVLLSAVRHHENTLTVTVQSPGEHHIAFIGTRAGKGGQLLHTVRGRHASYSLDEPGYVRATVSDAQGRKAWVQPLFVR